MTMPQSPNPFNQIRGTDALAVLDDGNTYTSSDIGQVGSADKIIDWGASKEGRPEAIRVFGNITSTEGDTTDETYIIALQFSDTSAHTVVQYQHSITCIYLENGAFDIISSVPYRYMRMYYTIGGTIGGTGLIIDNVYYTAF